MNNITRESITPASKSYYFLKSADGRYLQANLACSGAHAGQWSFWLAPNRGSAPCHEVLRTAEQYRAAAEPVVGPLVVECEPL